MPQSKRQDLIGKTLSLQHRAKIMTSMKCNAVEHPALWDQLYAANLQKLETMEALRVAGKRN